jgi:hypothetical protein
VLLREQHSCTQGQDHEVETGHIGSVQSPFPGMDKDQCLYRTSPNASRARETTAQKYQNQKHFP